MNSAESLELACTAAWPPVHLRELGRWRLRAAGGFTGRANSALAVGDPGIPLARALEQVCEFAHSHGLDPMVHAIDGSATESAIADCGWVPHTTHPAGHEVSVLLGPLTGEPGTAEVLDEPAPAWWELCAGTTAPDPAQRHVLTGAELVGYAVCGTTAAGRGAVVGDLLHVSRLAVRPEHRRRGLGTAVMGALSGWAAAHGATRTVLQVDVNNAAALALYARLGFTEHHRYRYWVPARACEDRSP
ncbi:GNAT family N-acetyltransferase [Amycolatopsis suaedae]|uniref:GNAT family N-acetyltransferase n=1 Tax=Amycolatopsis suaedae TaxID=2510978 RepID=A0A4Q7J6D9_9PSEU|nr:GNAT family N-acetyltransferase [Amycolatopsis suaedae]RZQ62699.1 GNAT family N-acetyltransferase [Amycolatopsis suaedae]